MRGILLLASVLAADSAPALGEIGAFYFDSMNQSQVWINIQPQNLEPGPNPIELNVTVAFPGRHLVGPPATLDLRVQAYGQVFPTRIRQLVLTLIIDWAEFRADGRELPRYVYSSCRGDWCTSDVIVTRLPFAVLRQLAAARDVEIHAFGFATRLTPSDQRALTSLVAAVAGGVTVK